MIDIYTLPDGTRTKNIKKYISAWKAKAEVVEDFLGLELHGFDPNFSFVDNTNKYIDVPLWFVDLLEQKLSEK